MALFHFLRKHKPNSQASHDPQDGQTLRLTQNQQGTLDAIRRYEARVLPRLYDTKRSTGRLPDAADERRLAAALRDHFLKAWRNAHQVRVRFRVTLPAAVVEEIQRHKAIGVELKALASERLSLTLLGPHPHNTGQRVTVGRYEVIPARERMVARRPADGETPVRIEAHDSKLVLVLPPPGLPTRLRGQIGANQGETQYRLYQIRKSAKRSLKRPVRGNSAAPNASR